MKLLFFIFMIFVSWDVYPRSEDSIDKYIAKQDLSTISRGTISFCASDLVHFGRYQDAIDFCDRVLEHQPNHPQAYFSKGAALAQFQKHEESLVQYDLAIQYDYEFTPAAYYYKGLSLFRLKRYEEALEAYDKAIAMGLDDKHTQNAHQRTLAKLGRL